MHAASMDDGDAVGPGTFPKPIELDRLMRDGFGQPQIQDADSDRQPALYQPVGGIDAHGSVEHCLDHMPLPIERRANVSSKRLEAEQMSYTDALACAAIGASVRAFVNQ